MVISKTALAATAAASVLGGGMAHAATVGTDTVTVSAKSTSGGSQVSSHSGTSTGTLNSSGTYTASFSNMPATIIGKAATLAESDVLTGTYSGGTFTATGGTTDVSGCTGSPFCGNALGTHTFTSVVGSLTTAAGGTITGKYSTTTTSGTVANSIYTFTGGKFSTGTVPLPPAVWLLGSGLLGLVGTARRRAKKA